MEPNDKSATTGKSNVHNLCILCSPWPSSPVKLGLCGQEDRLSIIDNIVALVSIHILTRWLVSPAVPHLLHPSCCCCLGNYFFDFESLPHLGNGSILHNVKCSDVRLNALEMSCNFCCDIFTSSIQQFRGVQLRDNGSAFWSWIKALAHFCNYVHTLSLLAVHVHNAVKMPSINSPVFPDHTWTKYPHKYAGNSQSIQVVCKAATAAYTPCSHHQWLVEVLACSWHQQEQPLQHQCWVPEFSCSDSHSCHVSIRSGPKESNGRGSRVESASRSLASSIKTFEACDPSNWLTAQWYNSGLAWLWFKDAHLMMWWVCHWISTGEPISHYETEPDYVNVHR